MYSLYLLERAGLSAPEEPGSSVGADFEAVWKPHDGAFEMLTSGQADAAAVWRPIATEADDSYQKGITELTRAELPNSPIVVSTRLSDPEVERIRTAFTRAGPSLFQGADGRDGTGDDLWYTDVRPADVETYQPFVKAVNKLGYGREIYD